MADQNTALLALLRHVVKDSDELFRAQNIGEGAYLQSLMLEPLLSQKDNINGACFAIAKFGNAETFRLYVKAGGTFPDEALCFEPEIDDGNDLTCREIISSREPEVIMAFNEIVKPERPIQRSQNRSKGSTGPRQ